MNKHTLSALGLIFPCIILPANSFAAQLFDIGLVSAGSHPSANRNLDLSGDGSTVVGTSDRFDAFRWSKSGGYQSLGVPVPTGGATNNPVYTTAVSYDGSVIVGATNYQSYLWRGWTWSATGGLTERTEQNSFTYGVSGSGAETSGFAGPFCSNGCTPAVYSGPLGEAELEGNVQKIGAVSGDGTKVVGETKAGNAAVWTIGTQPIAGNPQSLEYTTSLTELSGGSLGGNWANNISADGSIIVGRGSVDDVNFGAMLWTISGGAQLISPTGGAGAALDVTADGSTVAGWSQVDGLLKAGLWDSTNGWQDLADILQNQYGLDTSAWALNAAVAISDDGNYILGVGKRVDDPSYVGGNSGTVRAWMVDLSAPVPVPQAVWLFGSGLLGLIGVASRKKTA